MAPGWVHADRHVCNQADPHAGVTRPRLRRGERPLGQELQEHVKQDVAPVRLGEGGHGRAFRVAQIRRPLAPIRRLGIEGQLLLLQRLEAGVAREQCPALSFERRKPATEVLWTVRHEKELGEQGTEQCQPHPRG